MYLVYTIALISWTAYLSAESGASLPWSSEWQDKVDWFSEVPEAVLALTVGIVATLGWAHTSDLSSLYIGLCLLLSTGLAYMGKQSGTWAYLTWETHVPRNPDRESTLRPVNDYIANIFGWKLGDEGYSWVWAAVKGFILTLPIGGTGAVSFPLGHELGSHAKGRLEGSSNMWKEAASGGAIGLSCALFLLLTGVI